MRPPHLSRRGFLRAGLGALGGSLLHLERPDQARGEGGVRLDPLPGRSAGSLNAGAAPSDEPMRLLTAFDYGSVTRAGADGVVREYEIAAVNKEIEVAPGVRYPAWTYNGTVPGPTLRCTEGDRVRIHFTNASPMDHTIHFHGIHPADMDGVFEIVPPGGRFTYEFTAEPFGLFLYHCHVMPLRKHIEKGLYGTFIVDPPQPRPPAREFVMVLNGFDTDFDGSNEFYTVNGYANYFVANPISIRVGEPVRIYLVNMTEFDPINSFHLHGNVFRLYRTGTRLETYEVTDTVMLCQGERCILEFTYNYPGMFMFHAHQTEFSEPGWMGFFNVLP